MHLTQYFHSQLLPVPPIVRSMSGGNAPESRCTQHRRHITHLPSQPHHSVPLLPCPNPQLVVSVLSCPQTGIQGPGRPEARFWDCGQWERRELEGFVAEFDVAEEEEEDLSVGGEIYRSTLRLVECSMFAALSGLVYFLCNSLSIENYFGCFFGLPIVISSMRWAISAGRKTMLMLGILGFSMGTFWRLGANWRVSISVGTLVRALCAMGYVLISSFLIRENILDLITINLHASLAYLFVALGVNSFPSMGIIYAIFGFVLLLNSVFLAFLLHLLYSILLSSLRMKASLKLPAWLEKAL